MTAKQGPTTFLYFLSDKKHVPTSGPKDTTDNNLRNNYFIEAVNDLQRRAGSAAGALGEGHSANGA